MVIENTDISGITADSTGNFTVPERNKYDSGFGITEKTVDYISDVKGDPDWIREFRK
jgi:Fe-S cluster assembly protein SufB